MGPCNNNNNNDKNNKWSLHNMVVAYVINPSKIYNMISPTFPRSGKSILTRSDS